MCSLADFATRLIRFSLKVNHFYHSQGRQRGKHPILGLGELTRVRKNLSGQLVAGVPAHGIIPCSERPSLRIPV